MEFEANYDHGFRAHRTFLGDREHPVLLVEDLNLGLELAGMTQVLALPLFIEGVDASPCTVVAEIEG